MYSFLFLAVPFLSSAIPMELTIHLHLNTELHHLVMFFLVIRGPITRLIYCSDSHAIAVPIAVTCWVSFKSPLIDFVIGFPFTLSRNSKFFCME